MLSYTTTQAEVAYVLHLCTEYSIAFRRRSPRPRTCNFDNGRSIWEHPSCAIINGRDPARIMTMTCFVPSANTALPALVLPLWTTTGDHRSPLHLYISDTIGVSRYCSWQSSWVLPCAGCSHQETQVHHMIRNACTAVTQPISAADEPSEPIQESMS